MYCKKCNNKIDEGSKFCSFCGSKVEEDVNVGKVYCTHCGEQIDDNLSVCPYCGKSVKNTVVDKDDTENYWLEVLAFLIPFVGLIIWLCTKSKSPVKAQGVLRTTVIGFIFWFVWNILF